MSEKFFPELNHHLFNRSYVIKIHSVSQAMKHSYLYRTNIVIKRIVYKLIVQIFYNVPIKNYYLSSNSLKKRTFNDLVVLQISEANLLRNFFEMENINSNVLIEYI